MNVISSVKIKSDPLTIYQTIVSGKPINHFGSKIVCMSWTNLLAVQNSQGS